MKAFYAEMGQKCIEARKLKPLYNEIKATLEAWGNEKPDVRWMHHWQGMPIVITVWRQDTEWIAEHVLSVLRARFNCTYTMEVWGEAQKVIYSTKINGYRVAVQLIMAKECVWVPMPSTTYRLSCQ
jgi:hypothetical protein